MSSKPLVDSVVLPTVPDKQTVKEISSRTQTLLKSIVKYRNALVALSVSSHELHQAVKLVGNPAFFNAFPSQRSDNPYSSLISTQTMESLINNTITEPTASAIDSKFKPVTKNNTYFTPPASPTPEEAAAAQQQRTDVTSTNSTAHSDNNNTEPTQEDNLESDFQHETDDVLMSLGVIGDFNSKYDTRGNTAGSSASSSSSGTSSSGSAPSSVVTKMNSKNHPYKSLTNFKPQNEYYSSLTVNLHDLALRIVNDTEVPLTKALEEYLNLVSKWQDILSVERKMDNHTRSAEAKYIKMENKVQKSNGTPSENKLRNRDKAEAKWKSLKTQLNDYRFNNHIFITEEESKFLNTLCFSTSSLIKGTAINMGKIVRKSEMTCITLGVPLPFQKMSTLASPSNGSPMSSSTIKSSKNKSKVPRMNLEDEINEMVNNSKKSLFSNKYSSNENLKFDPHNESDSNKITLRRRASLDSVLAEKVNPGARTTSMEKQDEPVKFNVLDEVNREYPVLESFYGSHGSVSLDRQNSVMSHTSGIMGIFAGDQNLAVEDLNRKVEKMLLKSSKKDQSSTAYSGSPHSHDSNGAEFKSPRGEDILSNLSDILENSSEDSIHLDKDLVTSTSSSTANSNDINVATSRNHEREIKTSTKYYRPAESFTESSIQISPSLHQRPVNQDSNQPKRAHFDTNAPIAQVQGGSQENSPRNLADLYPDIAAHRTMDMPTITTLGAEPAVYVGEDTQSMMASVIDLDLSRNSNNPLHRTDSQMSTVRTYRNHGDLTSSTNVQDIQPGLLIRGETVSVENTNINSGGTSSHPQLPYTARSINNIRTRNLHNVSPPGTNSSPSSSATSAAQATMAYRQREQSRARSRSRSPSPKPLPNVEEYNRSRTDLLSNTSNSSDILSADENSFVASNTGGVVGVLSEDDGHQMASSHKSKSVIKSTRTTSKLSKVDKSEAEVYTKEQQKYFTVLHSFNARSGKELNLRKGEVVTVRKKQGTWLYAVRKIAVKEIPSNVLLKSTTRDKEDDKKDLVIKLDPINGTQSSDTSGNKKESRPKTVYTRVKGNVTKKEMGWIPVAFVKEVDRPFGTGIGGGSLSNK